MTKKTPFYNVGLEYGAKMEELFGYYLPLEYSTGHEEEYKGTRKRASLCDLDYMAEFTIKGPEALNFIQKVFTNDFTNLKTGSIRYTAMTNLNGNMLDDGTMWHLGESEYMFISGNEADYAWLNKYAENFDIELKNITSEWTTLSLQGPLSREILEKTTDVDLDSIKFYKYAKGKVSGVDCLIARVGFTGEFGYELHFHPKHADKMWHTIMNAGKEQNVVPCGQLALESLRQEAGFLLVGNEHNDTINPFEAGIGFTVKLDKKDFNGREALINIVKEGVEKRLVWFSLPGSIEVKTDDPILNYGKEVGKVTSGSLTPSTKHSTALGYVGSTFTIPGINYTINSEGKEYNANLSLVPLYDPGKTRNKK